MLLVKCIWLDAAERVRGDKPSLSKYWVSNEGVKSLPQEPYSRTVEHLIHSAILKIRRQVIDDRRFLLCQQVSLSMTEIMPLHPGTIVHIRGVTKQHSCSFQIRTVGGCGAVVVSDQSLR